MSSQNSEPQYHPKTEFYSIKDKKKSKFSILKNNLYTMAEIVLEQILELCDALENDDYNLCKSIITSEELIDNLEKENDDISQNAILDAIISRKEMGVESYNTEILLKADPLRFALFGIRVNIYLEQIGDGTYTIANTFQLRNVPQKIFKNDDTLNLSLARVATIIGMAVESLVEEKEHLYGSIKEVSKELNQYTLELQKKYINEPSISKGQLKDILTILENIEKMGKLSVNIAEELLRLTTGTDMRHAE